MSVEKFAQKNRRSNLTMFNIIRHNLAKKKLDPTLKPSNMKGMTNLTHFYAQKSKGPRRFSEIDPETLHMCSTCPSRGVAAEIFSFFFFLPNFF